MNDRGKLGEFLAQVIHWRWDEFVRAESDTKFSGLEAVVLALVRTCSEQKLGAIKLAIDRVDGKIETPIKIEYPKVWFIYPEAERVALPAPDAEPAPQLESGTILPAVLDEAPSDIPEEEPVTAATMSLRETLHKMADAPRQTVPVILKTKKEVEAVLNQDPNATFEQAPLVKSVIAANLMHLATEKNSFDAITEIFDQIDGKLVETIRFLGDDIFIPQYALEAPAGAVKNKEGIYMLEAKEIAEQWKRKFKKD